MAEISPFTADEKVRRIAQHIPESNVFERANGDTYGEKDPCTTTKYGSQCSLLKIQGEGLSFLGKIHGDFGEIEHLETSGNAAAFIIPSGLFLLFSNLKTLRIYNCNVVDIEPGAFRSLHRLEVLEISGNSNLTFDSVSKGISQLNSPNLRVFNISGNHNTEDLPGAVIRKPMFELLSNTSLKILDVSWTKLTTLLAPFDLLPHLETLNVSGTLLQGSSSCVSAITSLVNFSYMAIDHWPFSTRGYNNIQWMEEPHGLFKRSAKNTTRKYISKNGYLQQNLLKVIDVAVVQHFTYLRRHIEINLKDNALECDCELLTLTEDVNVSTTPFSCSFEGENRLISRNIAHAFVQNVCAEEDERNLMTLLGATSGVLGAVALLFVAVVIYRKRKHSPAKKNMPVIIHLKDCESIEEYPRRNPKFVVFLAYCSKDSEFVLKKIYRKLNNKLLKLLEDTEYVKDPDHLIILYDKHFLAGVDIDEICRKAITESHVTVAVVTENFLESSWCNLEVKMAISSNVPLLPLFIMKCDPGRLTGFLRVVYEEKVRLLWPDTSLLDDRLAEAEENKLLDTLCTHIMSYVQLHQDQCCNAQI
ncbi:toll-like receptor 4 [Mercenaria mercenaria]|uniref:toll-like receptor 4 n=1 Tax=Mercenaria mercenaria TaxID=6596 RepID=UPI00234EA758|nr:toll-like receptor 4 [Mercenaria mercenaria]